MNRKTIKRINKLLEEQEKFIAVFDVLKETRFGVRLHFSTRNECGHISDFSFPLNWDEAISILKQKAVACEKELKELGFEEDEDDS